MKLSIEAKQVLIDGKKAQILSGALHYFRMFPEQWEDRLIKLKNCGFNTVETYLSWHLHEETEGNFDFSGRLDFVQFIQLAAKLGLYVIVRPGPYICSECDLGALPGWLLGKPGLRLRCMNAEYLKYVKRYFDQVMPLLAPLQCTKGGPIVAMQIENEYGSYGSDKAYLRQLKDWITGYGIDIQLFTSDGAGESWLKCGTLPDVPATINYRDDPRTNMKHLDTWDTGYPNARVTMELWTGFGWHWDEQPTHHRGEEVAEDIRAVLEDGDSVNCYMFYGGTNFGFTSGANFAQCYKPLLTSYEVDGFLEEGGKPTAKYEAVQRVMEELRPGSTAPVTYEPGCAYPSVRCTEYISLSDALDSLSVPVQLPLPETMEYFGQSFGLIHYSTTIEPYHSGTFAFQNMQDRAIVMLNGNIIATIYRNDPVQTVYVNVKQPHSRLEILVENMGRVNFCPVMDSERKGMTGFVCENYRHLMDWSVRPLPLKENWGELAFQSRFPQTAEPGFYKAELCLPEAPRDTFLLFPEGIRGYVQVNGFNIGRYWNVGPQRTLYIPAPVLKQGRNEIVVFELHGLRSPELRFSAERILDLMGIM